MNRFYTFIEYILIDLIEFKSMIKFVDGKEVDRITGLVPVSKIKEFCKAE